MAQSTPQPTQFYVPVRYQDEAGNLLLQTQAAVNPGYTTVSADDSLVSAGMELISARSIVVYASNQGLTFPSTVIFTYRAGVKANVQIVYRDAGGSILFSETRQYAQGTHTITADDSRAPGRILHVGDHPVTDVLGARLHGFRAAWLNESGQSWQSLSLLPDVELGQLQDLATLLL